MTLRFKVASPFWFCVLILPVTNEPKSLTSPISRFRISLVRRYVRAVSAASLLPIVLKTNQPMPTTKRTTSKPSTARMPPTIKIIFFVLIFSPEIGVCKIVDERRIEQQAIDPIEHATMARQNLRSVFRAGAAFERALGQIAEYTHDIHYRRQRQRKP